MSWSVYMRGRLRAILSEGRCREDLRQFVWFGLGYGVVLVLGYLLLRQINLSLSAEEMGRFSYVMSLVGLTAAVFYQAPALAYIRFHDNHQISPDLRRKLFPFFMLAAVLAAVLIFWKTDSWLAMLFASIAFFFERTHVLRAQMRVGAVNVLKIVEIAVPLLALLLLSQVGALQSVCPSASTVLALYGFGYAACFLFPLRLKPCASPSSSVLGRYLAPVALTTVVAMAIENLTVVATKSFLGYEAAAQMGVAARNLIFIKALFQFFQMLYPVIYFREIRLGHVRTIRLYRGAIVLVAVVFVALMAIGAPSLYVLTGARAYLETRGVFVILSIAALFDFLFEMYALYFQYEIKTWKTTLVKAVFLSVLAVGLFALPSPTIDSFAYAILAASLTSSVPGLVWAVVQERCHLKGVSS